MNAKTIDVKTCGYVPDEDPKAPPCTGTGLVARTGEQAGMGIRYYKCQKPDCGATWVVYFKKPPKEEIVARKNLGRP